MKETRLKRRCEGYSLPNGDANPECLKWFLVEPEHWDKRIFCDSCVRLKRNAYFRKLMRERRIKAKELKKIKK